VRIVRLPLLAGMLATALIGFTTGGVSAYGSADNPQAQIEYSQNCNNPAYCQGPFGLGGVWIWIEIDGGPTTGTADAAGAVCEHFPGLGGDADPIRGEVTWVWSPTPIGFDATMGTWSDPNDEGWFVVSFPGFGNASFPVTLGHYAAHPHPAVNFELEVAP
jgi:hypothetical protein